MPSIRFLLVLAGLLVSAPPGGGQFDGGLPAEALAPVGGEQPDAGLRAEALAPPGGEQPGAGIAARVAAAAPGDTVRISFGTYIEPTIVLDRPIVLLGVGMPVLDGGTGDHVLVRIEADDVEVRGFVFRNVSRSFMEDRAAVRVEGATRCRIVDNEFENTFFGIYLARADDCEIARNDLVGYATKETDGGNGIHSWYSTRLAIRANTIRGHRDGIYLEFTEDSRVEGNTSDRNLRYGLHFMFSDRCHYEDNLFLHNAAGVAVMYADGVEMRRNRFEDAWGPSAYGLLLKEIKGAIVEGNWFAGNSVALFVEGTDRSRFSENVFADNGWAIKLMANATDNDFAGNAFFENTFDVATNSRTTNSRFDGNSWDRYRGYDLDRDGVGDVPFHPVRLFSLLVEWNEPALVLLRSVLVDALDLAERFLPALTPETLVDLHPLMNPPSAP